MKSSSAASLTTVPAQPLRIANNSSEQPRAKVKTIQAKSTLLPPSEEIINQLNGLALEYPFCVHYRQKKYDPL